MAEVQILYVATAGGLVQLASPGTSHRWRAVGSALAGEDVFAVRASAAEPLQAFAGSASGLYVTLDGGATWEVQRSIVVTALAAAPDGAIYAGTDGGIILQGRPGEWREVRSGPSAVVHLSVLPGGPVAAVYKNGQVDLLADGVWASANIVVPSASELVSSAVEPGHLYITADTQLVTRYGTRAIEGVPTGALVLLAGQPEVLLLGTIGPVLRSDDSGATLQPVDGPQDVRVLVSPPRFLDYAYAGTGGGELWLSSDRGRNWRKLHEGMAPVRDLSFARVR